MAANVQFLYPSASNSSTNAAYLSALRSSFYRIIHLIDDCSRDAAALEYALFRVDVLYQAIQRFTVLLSGRRCHFGSSKQRASDFSGSYRRG